MLYLSIYNYNFYNLQYNAGVYLVDFKKHSAFKGFTKNQSVIK